MADYIPKFEETEEINLDEELEVPSFDDTTPIALEQAITGSQEIIPEISKSKSAALGAVQGGTMGFADEIEGALRAGGEKGLAIIKKEDEKDLKELYKQYRDIARRRNKEAEEANPLAYGAGEIGGAIAGGLATGGGTLSLKGAAALGGLTGLGTSESSLVDGTPEDFNKLALDVGTGTALGLAGGGIAKGVGKLTSPKTLETAGSKIASSSAGISPTEEMVRGFDKTTGRIVEHPDIIKGIGKTAIEEGALPFTGGAKAMFTKADEAININFDKLAPIMKSAQQKLDQQLPQSLEKVGGIGAKGGDLYYKFINEIPDTSQKAALIEKLDKFYLPKIKQLQEADGNLQALADLKKEFYKGATSLKTNIYSDPNATEKMTEAKFLKQLAGITRQHIEDLAGTVDKEAAKGIKQTNQTIGNLVTYKESARELIDKDAKKSVLGLSDIATGAGVGAMSSTPMGLAALATKKGAELATGHPISRLAKIGAAKGAIAGSKALNTPLGQIVQKTAPVASGAVVRGPYTQEVIQNTISPSPATEMSNTLYNATDESLLSAAGKLKEQKGLEFYARELEDAIKEGDSRKKDRALFLIMQNPRSRKLFKEDKE